MRLLGSWIFPILLLLIGVALFFPGIALWDLWDLKEMRVAEAAREMNLTQEYYKIQVGYLPRWDISPLPVWCQALAMQWIGPTELAAHLPNALLACAALLVVFIVGQALHGAEFGFIWALLTFCPLSMLLLFRTGLPEPTQGFFLFASVACIASSAGQRLRGGASIPATLGGLFLGFAILSDGFTSLLCLLLVLTVFWLLNGGRPLLVGADWVLFLLALALSTLLWFGYEWAVNGPSFLKGFTEQPLWSPGQPETPWQPTVLGRLFMLGIGLFPTLWLALPAITRYKERDPNDFRTWMLVLLFVSLAQIVVVPGLALAGLAQAAFSAGYLAALYISQPVRKFAGRVRGLWTSITTMLLVIAVVVAVVPVWLASRAPWLMDKLATQGFVPALPWSGLEGLPAIFLIIVLMPVFRLGRTQKYTPAFLILATGWLLFFATAYPTLGRNLQDLVQGGYPRLFARTAATPSYAAAITFKSYAPLFYGRRHPALLCNGQADSCFLRQRVPVPVYKVVPVWAFGSGLHLAGYQEIDHAGPYVLFRKFKVKPGQ